MKIKDIIFFLSFILLFSSCGKTKITDREIKKEIISENLIVKEIHCGEHCNQLIGIITSNESKSYCTGSLIEYDQIITDGNCLKGLIQNTNKSLKVYFPNSLSPKKPIVRNISEMNYIASNPNIFTDKGIAVLNLTDSIKSVPFDIYSFDLVKRRDNITTKYFVEESIGLWKINSSVCQINNVDPYLNINGSPLEREIFSVSGKSCSNKKINNGSPLLIENYIVGLSTKSIIDDLNSKNYEAFSINNKNYVQALNAKCLIAKNGCERNFDSDNSNDYSEISINEDLILSDLKVQKAIDDWSNGLVESYFQWELYKVQQSSSNRYYYIPVPKCTIDRVGLITKFSTLIFYIRKKGTLYYNLPVWSVHATFSNKDRKLKTSIIRINRKSKDSFVYNPLKLNFNLKSDFQINLDPNITFLDKRIDTFTLKDLASCDGYENSIDDTEEDFL